MIPRQRTASIVGLNAGLILCQQIDNRLIFDMFRAQLCQLPVGALAVLIQTVFQSFISFWIRFATHFTAQMIAVGPARGEFFHIGRQTICRAANNE